MARNYSDWLTAFVDYASIGEAPSHFYFWVGASAIAGALQRKVWIDQAIFRWYANFYIILVAPPGIISKTTTASVAMDLLREVPGVHMGPEAVTWERLVAKFTEVSEAFEYEGAYHTQSAMTIASGELGNLIDPTNDIQLNAYISLWDGKSLTKETKTSGMDEVTNPWINLVGCTTPSWIRSNCNENFIGGGFASRCLFVYADKKKQLVAYPEELASHLRGEESARLIEDLTHISQNIIGPYKLTPEAKEWGKAWYEDLNNNKHATLDNERFSNYLARKQTHTHKLAMIIAASASDSRVITLENLQLATIMVTNLENEMPKVFRGIGQSYKSQGVEQFVLSIFEADLQGKRLTIGEAYKSVQNWFPFKREFEEALQGCTSAGRVKLLQEGNTIYVLPGVF